MPRKKAGIAGRKKNPKSLRQAGGAFVFRALSSDIAKIKAAAKAAGKSAGDWAREVLIEAAK